MAHVLNFKIEKTKQKTLIVLGFCKKLQWRIDLAIEMLVLDAFQNALLMSWMAGL